MSATRRPLILALEDIGLRSVLAARLSMAGEVPIVTEDHRDPALGQALRGAAILVIEESLIATTPVEWAETLRDQCWAGDLIIIANQIPETVREADGIAMIDRRRAHTAIPDLIRQWRSVSVDPVSQTV